jgi:DNA-binding response OmpR family regulator
MTLLSKVLVVDDERTLVDTIKYNLLKNGYDVCVAYDGVEAVEMARQERPDLVVLDVMLPTLDGFDVCRAIRKDMSVPVLMLTAKDEEIDKILGLELGADDYMTKPFSMRELMTRVKAMLRRVKMITDDVVAASLAQSAAPSRGTLLAGDFEVDVARHSILHRGEPLSLKPKEFDLLAFLAANPGQVFTRESLLEKVWGYSFAGDTRTVDVHVRGLREKIEDNPSEPRYVETVRGVGYRLKLD